MCDDREKLIAYLYDEASASERRLVDAHLTECADCRDELRAFRGVQTDLLAWDVPNHESVWKPFAAPQPTVWWRQVPAWGLAAAATLVFGLGLAGGFAGRVLAANVVDQRQVPVTASVAQPVVTPTASSEEVTALRQRLAQIERTLATQPAAPSATVAQAKLWSRFEQAMKETEGRINQRTAQKVYSAVTEMNRQRMADQATLNQLIAASQDANNGILARAISSRTEKEKE